MAISVVKIISDDHPYFDGAKVMQQMAFFWSKFKTAGVWFSEFVTSVPKCAPDRATILTGLDVDLHGLIANDLGEFDPTNTLVTALQAAGWKTHLVGKYLNRYGLCKDRKTCKRRPPGWDTWYAPEDPAFLGVTWRTAGFGAEPTDGSTNGVATGSTNQLLAPKTDGTEDTLYTGGYASRLIAKRAWSIIDAAAAADPLYIVLSPPAPHPPYTIEAWWASGNDGPSGFVSAAGNWGCAGSPPDPACALPPNYNIVEADKPNWMSGLPIYGGGAAESLTDDERVMQSFGDLFQQVFNKMAASGRHTGAHSTLYVFCSDNGRAYGEHRFDKKGMPHRCATHIPFAVHWANGPMRSVPHDVTSAYSTASIAPTIADILGVDLGYTTDGPSMKGEIISGGTPTPPTSVFFSNATSDSDEPNPLWSAVRTDDGWTYWKYPWEANTPRPNEELYDVINDPWQLTNRADDGGAHETKRAAMAAILEAIQGNFENRPFNAGADDRGAGTVISAVADASATTLPATYAKTLAIGERMCFVIAASGAAAVTLSSVTDAAGNTYDIDWGNGANDQPSQSHKIWFVSRTLTAGVTTGVTVLTATWSGAVTERKVVGYHVKNVGAFTGASLCRQSVVADQAPTCHAVTRGVSGYVIGAFSYADAGGAGAEGTGWQLRHSLGNSGFRRLAVVDNVHLPLNKTTYAPSCEINGNAGWTAVAAAYEQLSPPAWSPRPFPLKVLASGATTTDGTQFTIERPVTPAADKPIFFIVSQRETGTPAVRPVDPTISNSGLTWDTVDSVFHTPSKAHQLTILRSASPAPGTFTPRIDFANTQTAVQWAIVQFDGVVTTGTRAADSVVRSVEAEVTSAVTKLGVNMGAFANEYNGVLLVAHHLTNEITHPDWGLKHLCCAEAATPSVALGVMWSQHPIDTPTALWDTGSQAIALSVELNSETQFSEGGVPLDDLGSDDVASLVPVLF